MKTAIISDIHGNGVALEAALADLTLLAPDQVVCLGDAVQGGPQPAEVTDILMNAGYPIVMGNADAWLLSGIETANEGADDRRRKELNEVRDWSLSKLSAAHRAFIASFKPTLEAEIGAGERLLCFHGSPASFDVVILPLSPEADVLQAFEGHMDCYLTGGHTHCQFIRQLGRRYFFNPGSVGFAYRHGQSPEAFRADPWAEYAVMTSDKGALSLEFRRVPFDVERLRTVYGASGRPHVETALAQYSG